MHRRPQRVGMQTQQQLEDALVGVRADVALAVIYRGVHLLRGPRTQAPVLVIQEDAAILHRWRRLYKQTGPHVDSGVMRDGHIGPPRPRRDAHLPRERKQRIRRTAPVIRRDDKRQLHTGQEVRLALGLAFGLRIDLGIQDGRRFRRLPFAFNRSCYQAVCSAQLIDLRRLAQYANQDQVRRQRSIE